jgi:hypothetical protein
MGHASLNTLPGEGECIPGASLHSRSFLPAESNSRPARRHINKGEGPVTFAAIRREKDTGI